MRKYQLPSNHELFLERTLHDHLVDFYIDKFEKKPIESHRNENGDIQFKDTGDDLVDRWEEQIANGEIPDLMEAFDEESVQHIKKIKAAAIAKDPYQGLSFKETFDKISSSASAEGLTVGSRASNAAAINEDLRRTIAERIHAPMFGIEDEYLE